MNGSRMFRRTSALEIEFRHLFIFVEAAVTEIATVVGQPKIEVAGEHGPAWKDEVRINTRARSKGDL